MSWKLEGTCFEMCSAHPLCPCTASLAPGTTHDRGKRASIEVHEDGLRHTTRIGDDVDDADVGLSTSRFSWAA